MFICAARIPGILVHMDVLIILGSKSDMPVGEKARNALRGFGLDCRIAIASAHRTPERVRALVDKSGAKVFIAIAGLSAALPGFVAAHTNKPVIGIPVSGKVNLDSILSITQMPPGVPVAAVGLDSAENGAILAAQMIALSDPRLEKALGDYRSSLREKVMKDSREAGDFDV